MPEPSIKGSTFEAVVTDVLSAVESGRIAPDDLSASLERAYLEYLEPDYKISSASWYPIDAYRRMIELLLEHVGGGDRTYLERRGADAASRLHEAGIYQQLEYVSRINESRGEHESILAGLKRQLRLILSVARSIFSFGEWGVEDDPDSADRLRIVISDAAAMPDVAIPVIQGFMNRMGEFSDSELSVRWRGSRAGADRVVYRMADPIPQ